jgi:hypothetical protein
VLFLNCAGNRYHKKFMVLACPERGLLTLPGMTEGSDTTLTAEQTAAGQAPSGLVAGIKSFAAGHGGAKAVIEYVGKRGARIVLIGADGVWADQFAEGTDVARQACARAGVAVENSWERELMDQMRPSNDLWRSMARRTMAR